MLAISGLHERFLFLCIYFFCLCAAVFSSVNMPCICSMFIRLLPWWLRGESVCLQCGRPRFNPWVRKIPWGRKWLPIPGFLPEKSHGHRSLGGYSPWGHKELDATEQLTTHSVLLNTRRTLMAYNSSTLSECWR